MIGNWFNSLRVLTVGGHWTICPGIGNMETGLVTLVGLDVASYVKVRRYKINF
jgi:hypothetical protein